MTLQSSYTIKFAGDLANYHLVGRGYRVVGQSVGAASHSEAMRIVRLVLGDDVVTYRLRWCGDDGDGDVTYCYRDREAADGDDTGAAAHAVVSYEIAEDEEV